MLTPIELDFVRKLVYQQSAIRIPPERNYLIETRLLLLVRKKQFASVKHLIDALRCRSQDSLRRAVVEAMTTNETSFFRDQHPFSTLCSVIIPELLENISGRKLVIWCAACSTGQEPYSIALLLAQEHPRLASKVEIVATDLSVQCINKAKRGIYSDLEASQGISVHMRDCFFRKHGTNWELRCDLREAVQFRTGNLADPNTPFPLSDVVFLRNVLIYFDVATKMRILKRIEDRLRPNGRLFLGTQETDIGLDTRLASETVGRSTCYRLQT